MKLSFPSNRSLEVYKCAVLTIIALILSFYFARSIVVGDPVRQLTLEDIRTDKAKRMGLPAVYVFDGSVGVSGTVAVDVTNTVDIVGTVEIE